MDRTARAYPSKKWNEEFKTDRDIKDEIPYVRLKSNIGTTEGIFQSVFTGIENFMKDVEGSIPCDQVDEVVQFCQGVSPADLRSDAVAGKKRHAWLDDRKYSPENKNGTRRDYIGNPLTASQLYQILQARV